MRTVQISNKNLPRNLKSLCWTILGRWEQIGKENQIEVSRVYNRTMTLVHLVTDNLAVPTKDATNRLRDLAEFLAQEFTSGGVFVRAEDGEE